MELELSVNGVITSLDVAPNEPLVTLLRREGHSSVRQGCEQGDCGACTVLIDGVSRPSCVMLAAQAGGCSITTAESLGTNQKLHPLQQAFIDLGVVQCGFCTSGMLLSAYALLRKNPQPSEEEVREALSGNLCRCNDYGRIVQAVQRAADVMRGDTSSFPEPVRMQQTEEEAVKGARKREEIGLTTKIPLIALSNGVAGGREAHLQIVGQSPAALNAQKFVLGKPAFTADVLPAGTLYGRILTSPHAHAVIRSIDVSQARALQGVHVVLTYKDLPRVAYSSAERLGNHEDGLFDQYCLDYILRYVGDRVAVVAAESPEIAEQALQLIDVEYDVLPAMIDPRQALDDNAPQLHPESESRGIYDAAHNIAARVRNDIGDVERGFAESDLIVENEYVVPPLHQASLEKYAALTYFDEDDNLIVRSSSEAPHHIRRVLSTILQLPIRHIRVIKPSVGSSFGGKQQVVLEDLCALLTLATNRPVLLSSSRTEEFATGRMQSPCIIRMKSGVKRDGTLVAQQLVLLTSTGAYGTHPLIGQKHPVSDALALYPCAHMRYVSEILYTCTPPASSAYGYGRMQEFLALECHLDEIARQVGIDALELRRRNWLRTGDVYPWSRGGERSVPVFVESSGLPECLKLVEEKLRWSQKRGTVSNGRLRRGVGVALTLYGTAPLDVNASSALLKLNEDGSFDLFTGMSNDGSDATTLFAQIVAEVLSVPLEDVLVHDTDSSLHPFDAGVHGSDAFYVNSGAVKKVAEQMRRQILAVAGRALAAVPETLKIQAGVISNGKGQSVTIQQIAEHALFIENRQLLTTAAWKLSNEPLTFAAQGVEVEVDTETGSVRVVNAVTALDAGRIMNPQLAESQLRGSVARGLSVGLSEELVYDNKGQPYTNTLSSYHLLNAADMPALQTYFIETSDPAGPFGAKAVAESAGYGIAPAIANAVADALGRRIRQYPLVPERVLRAIHAQQPGTPPMQKRV